jgi:hypothetical protein
VYRSLYSVDIQNSCFLPMSDSELFERSQLICSTIPTGRRAFTPYTIQRKDHPQFHLISQNRILRAMSRRTTDTLFLRLHAFIEEASIPGMSSRTGSTNCPTPRLVWVSYDGFFPFLRHSLTIVPQSTFEASPVEPDCRSNASSSTA